MKLRQWLSGLRTLLFGDITGNSKKSTCSQHLIGMQGESLALQYMKRLGWRLVDRNIRVGIDELDLLLISPDEKVMAIVEVRTTANVTRSPEWTLNKKKRLRMVRVAKQVRSVAKSHRCALRVDLIAVTIREPEPLIRHYEGIFPIPRAIILSRFISFSAIMATGWTLIDNGFP